MKRLIVFGLFLLCGCTDAFTAQVAALGNRASITLYAADGSVIHKWTSTGVVHAEENSDGWYFEDSQTKRLVRVSGTVVVESLDE